MRASNARTGPEIGQKITGGDVSAEECKTETTKFVTPKYPQEKKKKRIFKISWDGRRPLQRGAVELNSLVKWSFL